MKKLVSNISITPNATQAAVLPNFTDYVLTALLKKSSQANLTEGAKESPKDRQRWRSYTSGTKRFAV
jgi:hypothetical protein